MTDSVLDDYLAGVDPAAVPLSRALDAAIRAAHPAFDVAIKYRLLMYALHRDWRHWVCAVDARTSGVGLRFLYGVLLDDPRRVLRAGSSVLKTWDFDLDDEVDPEAVGAYVTEAVRRYDEFRAGEKQVLANARETARPGRRPKVR